MTAASSSLTGWKSLRPLPLETASALVKSRRPGVNRRDLLRMRRPEIPASSARKQAMGERGGSELVRAHRPAMGSYFEVRLPAGTPGAVDLACRALDLIDVLEAQLTVYRDDSEVSRLDRKSTRLNSSHPLKSRMPSSA